jgi:CSLREA domain-containing protein
MASGAAMTTPDPATLAGISAAFGQIPLGFEVNQGQTAGQVSFLARGPGYAVFLTPNEAVLSLSAPGSSSSLLRMQLLGSNSAARPVGLDPLPGTTNYLSGNDPSQWHTNVPSFARVQEHGVYPGVDLVYYGNQRQLEYDFTIAPGADPGLIRLAFEGADSTTLDAHGNLVLHTAGGDVVEHAPVLYQDSSGVRQSVSGHYVLHADGQVGFAVGSYDTTKSLVIDPTLSYSTYLGGSDSDLPAAIAVDASGNAYVTGVTYSSDFPTASPVQSFAGSPDVFVTKLKADGSALVYSTFLGGNDEDFGLSIALDSADNAYVSGSTRSNNFPTTPGAFQTTRAGNEDAFVFKLNAAGSGLVYSTLLGGSNDEKGSGIAVDSAGNAYIGGYTFSPGFPTTAGSFQPVFAGQASAFVAKVNAAGSGLVYSTFVGGDLGGSGLDSLGRAIAVDSSGSAYITGRAEAINFPTTPGAFQPAKGGGQADAFVTKLSPSGSALVYSTFLGGSGVDDGTGIAVDSAGNAYVIGDTSSTDFPTNNPLQPANGSYDNTFISKLDPTGSTLVYSTYFGGSDEADGFAIGVDAVGSAYIAGYTLSPTNFPTKNTIQSAYGGGPYDGYVARLNAAGTSLDFSSFLGGSNGEIVGALAIDPAGNLFLAGYTNSTDFPTTPGAFQPAAGGVSDVFVMKIATTTSPLSLVVNTTDDEVDPGNGTTSLREAITAASAAPGSNISFDPAVFPAAGAATIQLIDDAQHRTLELAANVTIVGPGDSALSVRGGGVVSNFSVFTVDVGVTATVSGLTVTAGRTSANGGGIQNGGTLALLDCAITANSAAIFGAGIYSSGLLTLTSCSLASNNTGADGGGLFVDSGITQIIGGNISGNSAGTEGAGIEANSGTMMVTGTAITNNKAGLFGGGIRNLGTMSLVDVSVNGNTADSASGGIINRGTLTMTDSTVSANKAPRNGGVANNSPGVVTMTACTISGNLATTSEDGGIANIDVDVTMTLSNCTVAANTAITSGGGIGNLGTLLLNNCTIAGNAATDPAGVGGGIYFASGKLTLHNTIVAGNLRGFGSNSAPSDIFKTGAFVLDTQSTFNLIGPGGAGDIAAFTLHNRLGVDPHLGPLQDNGGLTQTMSLLDSSPAFDAGSNALLPVGLTTDGRAAPRVFDGIVDIGAFESQTVLAAPSLVVNTALADLTVGDNKTSLLEAIILANNKLGGGTITFDPGVFPVDGSATIQIINDIAHGTLGIAADVRIVGPGAKALSIRGGGVASNFSVFFVAAGNTVAISGLTIEAGYASFGGGIYNLGSLTLTDCTVAGNSATNQGAGIYSQGTLIVTGCTIANNGAPKLGGGLAVFGSLTMINTTVARNAALSGGGIGGKAAMTLTNCTVVGNTDGTLGFGGGIEVESTLTLRNTIVAGNFKGPGIPLDDITLAGGTLDASSSFNLIGEGGSGGLVNGANQNRIGLDPRLGPLGDNGGPTQTMALLAGSPAFNAGSNALVPAGVMTDQRGVPRVFNGTVDIGAFESQTLLAAPSLTVNTTADEVIFGSGKTTLREAIALAAVLGGQTIAFDPAVFPANGAATIVLSSDALHDALQVQANMTIVGPGSKALTVKGTGSAIGSNVFIVAFGVTAAISGLTVTGGHAYEGGGIFNIGNLTLTDTRIVGNYATAYGGGITNAGNLSLNNCTIANNTGRIVAGGGVFGGGIFSSGTFTMTNTTVSTNSAYVGGGIYITGVSTLTNCTIDGNQSNTAGGIYNGATLTATNDTIVANRSLADTSGGIGIDYTFNAGGLVLGTVLLRNTIVAGNYKGASPSNTAGDILVNQGTVDPSSSYNMIGSGGAGGLKDRAVDAVHNNRLGVTNTGLGLLQDNGGPTQTVALLIGSPAHNAGSNSLVPPGVSTDQRGLPRFTSGVTDIGAYESQDIPALLAVNPLVPGKSAVVIVASPGNDKILISAVKLKNGPFAIKRTQASAMITVTINGVAQGSFFPTSRDVFIAAGAGKNRVKLTGALAGSVKLHAIDGSLRVTTVDKARSVTRTLRVTPKTKPLNLTAAVVGGPLSRYRV